MQKNTSQPFDFAGFDRRFIGPKLYLEDLEDIVAESVEVAICTDTSGSVGNDELAAFIGELDGILGAYLRDSLWLIGPACQNRTSRRRTEFTGSTRNYLALLARHTTMPSASATAILSRTTGFANRCSSSGWAITPASISTAG
jgi:hypothetical protein